MTAPLDSFLSDHRRKYMKHPRDWAGMSHMFTEEPRSVKAFLSILSFHHLLTIYGILLTGGPSQRLRSTLMIFRRLQIFTCALFLIGILFYRRISPPLDFFCPVCREMLFTSSMLALMATHSFGGSFPTTWCVTAVLGHTPYSLETLTSPRFARTSGPPFYATCWMTATALQSCSLLSLATPMISDTGAC